MKIVRNLGSSLSDITYVLDELTAGLHPADADRIGKLFEGLRDAHNNVLVVEHSRQMLEPADHVVELGYLTLGQPTSTCSGGEIQRIKLSSELGTLGNVYVLDEPCNGLHAKDVETLTALLQRMVDAGNTVVAIEHRMEFVAQADWVIDMKPESGDAGGEVMFAGTPGELLGCKGSKTADFLRHACC